MANSPQFSGTWGGVSNGYLSITAPVNGQGYCGDNVTTKNFGAVSIYKYTDDSYRRGFTAFHYGVRGYSGRYSYFMTSNGQGLALSDNQYRSFDVIGPYIDKDDPSYVSFVMCASLNYVDIEDVTIVGTAGNDLFVGDDGKYYHYDGSIVDIPSGVTVSSEPFDNVYLGSDGKYYSDDGEVFQNLPSGVIPVLNNTSDVYTGSDGNYYDIAGDEILEDLAEGITPVGSLGEAILGSDGNYYKIDGSEAFINLPEGVEIVSYDSNTGDYIGSDGIGYDIEGNVAVHCNGDLLQYSNVIRLSIDCEDILGNQVNIGGDIPIGTSSVNFPTGALIRKINRIVARNMSDGVSCGNGNLNIKADIVGAKIGIDWETFDIDVVLGTYTVANCLFRTCDKYADYIYNSDLPLGFAHLTDLDVGYYCMTDELILSWEGFDNSEFPYCCGSYDTTVNEGGELGKENTNTKVDVDIQCICDGLESINDTLNSKLQLINDTISDKFDSLIQAINDKDMDVTVEGDTIQVSPCEPVVQVTNPVNNITVSPCSPVVQVTNPVNNITVTPCEPVVQNVINEGDCVNDNSDLIECLEGLFKKDDDSITDIVDDVFKTTYQGIDGEMHTEDITEVIRKKECENVVECIVEPVNMAYEGKGKYIDKDMLEQN